MNCYLKISYLTRHKKYRFWRDRPINFQQINRELLVNLPPESIMFLVNKQLSKKEENGQSLNELKMNEQQLILFLKKMPFQENETIKIRIIEEDSKNKDQRSMIENEGDSINLPNILDRQRSKSQEITCQSPIKQIKTDVFEVTQQFLCNSSFDFAQNKWSASNIESILKDLQSNNRGIKRLLDKKKLINIPMLYLKMKKTLEEV